MKETGIIKIMKQGKHPGNIKSIVSSLNKTEKSLLLQELLAAQTGAAPEPQLSAEQLEAAEQWFLNMATMTASPAFSHARGRMWLIFMLLRYGAMRLKEIFALGEEDCQFGAGYARGSGGKIWFPPSVASKLAEFWLNWPGKEAGRYPLLCDDSLVRRSLGACARACSISPSLLSVSSLRRHRGMELERRGLHPTLAEFYTGKRRDPAPFTPVLARELIQRFITKENQMKTSARNVFTGQIAKVDEQGILVSITVRTAQGLEVTSIITKTSQDSLKLAEGMPITALIKAPWVSVLPVGSRAEASTTNCYQGVVAKVNKDALACEIQVKLPQDIILCSLYANGASPSADIREGVQVMVTFSPFAVILTAN